MSLLYETSLRSPFIDTRNARSNHEVAALCLSSSPGVFLFSQNFCSEQEFTVLHHSHHVNQLQIHVDKKKECVLKKRVTTAKGTIKACESIRAFYQIRMSSKYLETL